MNKSLTIVIPNYNGAEILKQNLPTVLNTTQKYNAPIILVDDASTDNSIQTLKENFQIKEYSQNQSEQIQPMPGEITLITKNQNEGFSSTVNIGVKAASTELVCLLNSDVIPTENFLDSLLPYFNNPKIAAVGMLDQSDDEDIHGRGKFILQHGFLLHQKLANSDGGISSGKTGWVSCGSGVFNKQIWETLGGLDELLNPFYFEDVDYGYRAWKSGYEMYFEEKSVVQHIHKKGAIKTNYDEQRIKTISYRNQWIFNWKNLTDKELVQKHLQAIPKNVAIAIKNKDYAMLKGLMQAAGKLSSIQIKKQLAQNEFKKTDNEVIQSLQ